jgi:hypothetical protein
MKKMSSYLPSLSAAAVCISQLFTTAAEAQDRSHLAGVARLLEPTNSIPLASSIINGNDLRTMVPLGGMPNAEAFDAVGMLRIGRFECTGTLVELPGFTSNSGFPIVLTAGHCLPDNFRNNMTFSTVTVNPEGRPSIYTATVIDGSSLFNGDHDIAILLLDRPLPPSITPALAFVDRPFNVGENISTIGYGAGREREGLVGHINCPVADIIANSVIAACNITSRMSGGPVITGFNNGRLRVSAVINTIFRQSLLTRHTVIRDAFLRTIPFLTAHSQSPAATIGGNTTPSFKP